MKTITTVTVLDENSSRWLFMKIHTQYKLVFDTTHRIAACSTVGMRELWRHVAFFAYEQAIGIVIGAARSSRPIPAATAGGTERFESAVNPKITRSWVPDGFSRTKYAGEAHTKICDVVRMLKSILNSTSIIVMHLAIRLVSQPDMP